MKAYGLRADDNLKIVQTSFLYDIDEDFTSKEEYIKRAKALTAKVNQRYNLKLDYKTLFGAPRYEGWCICNKCGAGYWNDEGCECEE